MDMANTLAYLLDGKIYINLTNMCTNDCIFCLRKDKDDVVGQTLWLDSENSTANDVIQQFENLYAKNSSNEVIFCGYGEPMMKLELLKEVSKHIKTAHPTVKIRVNTNGHANFINKRNVVPELKGLVDEFSISLNGENESEYNELSKPKFEGAYAEMKNFTKACQDEGISTVMSVVEGYKGRHINLDRCEQIANTLWAKFKVREWIQNGY